MVFLLSPTRERMPWSGPPVFDVLGWHQPYPAGDFIPYWRGVREEPDSWLSVMEFYELLMVLPSEVSFRLDPSASLRAVQEWLDRNPGREDSFPVSTILGELEGREKGPPMSRSGGFVPCDFRKDNLSPRFTKIVRM